MPATIPIVDFASFRDGAAATRQRIAMQLHDAATSLGFVVIDGHGIAPMLGQHLRDVGLDFFARPLEQKLSVRRPRNDQNRGYIPYGEETLVRMSGGESPPDAKEVFAIGPDNFPDNDYYTGPQSYPNFAPNLWPPENPQLRQAMLSYWQAMEALMRMLGEAFALGLALPADTFADVLDDTHSSQLRLLHYPPLSTPAQPGQLRAGEHSDVGMMTILRNDPVPGGLQVKARDGTWLDAPAIADTYILNIGDLLMRWTNDRLISTAHRVAVPPVGVGERTRRLSIGFFVGPRYNAIVECLPTCQSKSEPAKYAPISVHDYRTGRFAAGAGDNAPFESPA